MKYELHKIGTIVVGDEIFEHIFHTVGIVENTETYKKVLDARFTIRPGDPPRLIIKYQRVMDAGSTTHLADSTVSEQEFFDLTGFKIRSILSELYRGILYDKITVLDLVDFEDDLEL